MGTVRPTDAKSEVYLNLWVPGLLDHPRPDRVLGGSEDVYPAGAVLNNGKDVDLRFRLAGRR